MPKNGLYIQLFSIHGLIRGKAIELGRDADTGGQVKYVVELARTLAQNPAVDQVDLITRLVDDKSLSSSYAQPIEPLADKARIVRIQCGGRRYIRKELLWPHMDEFIDKTIKFIKTLGRIPDIYHGHYADGGYVAKELASIFNTPFLFTGHSMGRHKKNKLIGGGMSSEEINRRYRMDHRINVEERIIKEAERIITSTRHEINKQYGLYDNFAAGRYEIIPPGIEIDIFYPYYKHQLEHTLEDELSKQAHIALLQELQRFWVSPGKPFILALCRPDQRKNIAGLITAYGEDRELQAIANLAIFAGIRKDISNMEENEQGVLTEMLLLMDRYDLYGKLAIPKKHDFSIEVPELYRLCAESRGVFVNPALVEPFGITLIEAAACGLPIIATQDGGPADIIANCDNGILIDPTSPADIAGAARKLLVEKELWQTCSQNGINLVRRHYSWDSHCSQTLKVIRKIRNNLPVVDLQKGSTRQMAMGRRLTALNRLLITDIDNTLVGDREGLAEFLPLIKERQNFLGWGVATGRSLNLTTEILNEYDIPVPDILICSVGSEICYGPTLMEDRGWQQHLAYRWQPELIREELARLKFLTPQEPETQRRFKISYYMEDDPELLAEAHRALRQKRLRYHLIYSHGQFLDILPYRASKGKAIRYLCYKWEIPLGNTMVCGDSGNDEDMLRGETCGVVVGNYSKEMLHLKGRRRIFFSRDKYARGIIDGIKHYNFFKEQQ